ncbi:hypothetical protein PBCV1_a032R [Paramecium bursaria Chlorella virus 1]|uniref:Uncharacterized protein n=1 Tax=Paramecium bursaria Chlorella virus 1 TaxID=10506 RepID=Q89367_PBCV1|nr:hypothetical protein PBCV1_a032R [Paramecium bursaria Chlorella virus 1]AAC96400.1 hypothetical protein [Paramecium bursaria Chlorella virus 1]
MTLFAKMFADEIKTFVFTLITSVYRFETSPLVVNTFAVKLVTFNVLNPALPVTTALPSIVIFDVLSTLGVNVGIEALFPEMFATRLLTENDENVVFPAIVVPVTNKLLIVATFVFKLPIVNKVDVTFDADTFDADTFDVIRLETFAVVVLKMFAVMFPIIKFVKNRFPVTFPVRVLTFAMFPTRFPVTVVVP